MKHHARVELVVASSLKPELVTLVSSLENYLVLSIFWSTTENYSALNDIALDKLK
jgi:hypothetical protein